MAKPPDPPGSTKNLGPAMANGKSFGSALFAPFSIGRTSAFQQVPATFRPFTTACVNGRSTTEIIWTTMYCGTCTSVLFLSLANRCNLPLRRFVSLEHARACFHYSQRTRSGVRYISIDCSFGLCHSLQSPHCLLPTIELHQPPATHPWTKPGAPRRRTTRLSLPWLGPWANVTNESSST